MNARSVSRSSLEEGAAKSSGSLRAQPYEKFNCSPLSTLHGNFSRSYFQPVALLRFLPFRFPFGSSSGSLNLKKISIRVMTSTLLPLSVVG